jgi:hypothetical protein
MTCPACHHDEDAHSGDRNDCAVTNEAWPGGLCGCVDGIAPDRLKPAPERREVIVFSDTENNTITATSADTIIEISAAYPEDGHCDIHEISAYLTPRQAVMLGRELIAYATTMLTPREYRLTTAELTGFISALAEGETTA